MGQLCFANSEFTIVNYTCPKFDFCTQVLKPPKRLYIQASSPIIPIIASIYAHSYSSLTKRNKPPKANKYDSPTHLTQGVATLTPGLCARCPFRSDKFGCARHIIQGKLDALLSLARTVRAYRSECTQSTSTFQSLSVRRSGSKLMPTFTTGRPERANFEE